MLEKCETCGFYVTNPKNLRQGGCHARPPQTVAVPVKGPLNQTGIQQMSIFPAVSGGGIGCGLHKPKEEE